MCYSGLGLRPYISLQDIDFEENSYNLELSALFPRK